MTGRLLIYGAAGFTGRLIVEEALSLGLPVVLGGRTQSSLEALARRDGLAYRVASVDSLPAVAALLDDVAVVLNAAGPFRLTAMPLARACVERGVHYLDISGEFEAIESLASLGERAREQHITIVSGTGFDVVASDCLAALVVRELGTAQQLSIALRGLNTISRGSALTVFDRFGEDVAVRRKGSLTRVPAGALTREVDFGTGATQTTAVSWADVASAYYTTGVPDITVYYEMTPMVRLGLNASRYGAWLLQTPAWRWWQGAGARMLADGPSMDQRSGGRADVVAHAVNAEGDWAEARLQTPEVYSFSAISSVDIADRVLAGDFRAGFQTPARAYGPEYVLSLPGVQLMARRVGVGKAPREQVGVSGARHSGEGTSGSHARSRR